MNHGIVEVFAYQETLLIMAVFGIAILAMVWVGFRRWLQYKERMGRLSTEQLERVEARLKAVEHIVSSDRRETAAEIEARRTNPLPDMKHDEA